MKKNNLPENYIKIDDVKDIQLLLLELLKTFHNICEKHGLIYNIFGGTLLGAVRHKGFIPWDDDIDVTMPRPDYDRFISIVNEKYSDKFIVKCYPDTDYAYPFAKLLLRDSYLIEDILRKKCKYKYRLGLYIDVFPVDGYPIRNEFKYFKKLKYLKRGHDYNYIKFQMPQKKWKKPFFLLKGLLVLYSRIFPLSYWTGRMVQMALSIDYQTSDVILLEGAGWNEKGKLDKSTYLDRRLYDFEDTKVWGIRDYDEHLTRLYGNYMKLPAMEKRVSNHDYRLYVDKDYAQKVLGDVQ